MKLWTWTAFVTGIIVLPFVLRKHKQNLLPLLLDKNKRYAIDDYIADQSL